MDRKYKYVQEKLKDEVPKFDIIVDKVDSRKN